MSGLRRHRWQPLPPATPGADEGLFDAAQPASALDSLPDDLDEAEIVEDTPPRPTAAQLVDAIMLPWEAASARAAAAMAPTAAKEEAAFAKVVALRRDLARAEAAHREARSRRDLVRSEHRGALIARDVLDADRAELVPVVAAALAGAHPRWRVSAKGRVVDDKGRALKPASRRHPGE